MIHNQIRTPIEWAATGNWQTLANNTQARVDFVKRIQAEAVLACLNAVRAFNSPSARGVSESALALETMYNRVSK